MRVKKSKLKILFIASLLITGVGFSYFNYLLSNDFDEQQFDPRKITIGNHTNIKMQYISDTSYRLTATVEPSNAGYKNVTWSLYWQNDSSSFAKGKDVYEYVQITQTSTDTLSIVLECLQPFGETIIVKVTSVDNMNIFATCNIEYGRRISEVTAILNGSSANGQVISDGSIVELTADVTYNDPYTYNTLYDYTYEYVPLSNYNSDTVSERGTYNFSAINGYFETLLNTNVAFSQTDFISYIENNMTSYGTIQKSFPYYGDIDWEQRREITQDEFITQLNKTNFTFQVTVGDVSDTITCKFNCSPPVTDVSLSEESIVF